MSSQEDREGGEPGQRPAGEDVPPDNTIAHSARIYDYWLGGTDNYEADREAANQAIAADPAILAGVRANREFLRRAVRYLAGEAGVRQFLDIGAGLPTADNVHEVAQCVAPESRIVYVDHDPIVAARARALLTSTPEGATAYVHADARDTATIVREAARTLDLARPVAVIVLMVVQYIPDAARPEHLVAGLMDAVPSGSYLVLSSVTTDIAAGDVGRAAARLNARMGGTQLTARSRQEIARFFRHLDLVDPGLVPLPEWRAAASAASPMPAYAGVGRKR